jgi:hypothetical protein
MRLVQPERSPRVAKKRLCRRSVGAPKITAGSRASPLEQHSGPGEPGPEPGDQD